MQFNGMMYGMNGSYQMTYKDVIFIRPEVRWAYGHTDYTAGPLGETYEFDQTPSMIFEPRLLMGSPLKATKKLTMLPYSGVGFRYKRDDGTDTVNQRGQPGTNRINKSWYIPLGTRFQYEMNDRWDIRGFIEYDWFIRGRQTTYQKKYSAISDTGVAYREELIPSTGVNKQKEGWGAKVELLVGYRFDKVGMAFGPYINYWHIQKSSLSSVTARVEERGRVYNFHTDEANEPNNVTKEIGLKVNFYF